MPRPKPKVFVGSAKEARKALFGTSSVSIADTFVSAIGSRNFNVEPWWEADEFNRHTTTIEALLHAADNYDFGFFIFTPEDITRSRSKEERSVRDNVLFEFGLFLGRLGPNRVTVVRQDIGRRNRTASDLLGVIMPSFTALSQDDLKNSAREAVERLVSMAEQQGLRVPRIVPEEYGHDPGASEVYVRYAPQSLQAAQGHLRDYNLLLVAMKADSTKPFWQREDIAISPIRACRPDGNRDVTIAFQIDPSKLGLSSGNVLDLIVFRCPTHYASPGRANNVQELFDNGCDVIADGGVSFYQEGD